MVRIFYALNISIDTIEYNALTSIKDSCSVRSDNGSAILLSTGGSRGVCACVLYFSRSVRDDRTTIQKRNEHRKSTRRDNCEKLVTSVSNRRM